MDLAKSSVLEIEKLFTEFDSSSSGLAGSEVEKRLLEYGENRISSQENETLKIFLRQFKSPFTYLLIGATVLSFFIGEKIDSAMIMLFIVLNSALGFYQEFKSEQTVKLLKKYLTAKIKTIRDGEEVNIEVTKLVPGDIICLEPGDIVPADARLIESYNLSLDESILTGESVPAVKTSDIFTSSKESHNNCVLSGTTVVSGNAKAIIISTGKETDFAKIVKLSSQTKRESVFDRNITTFSKFTLWVVLLTLVAVISISLAIKPNPSLVELILFSVALAVSVIPEALPVVTTFSVSLGALELAKKSVVVKRLSAIEDLGGMEILCTDKTGTITQNKLSIDEVKSNSPEDTLYYANLASFFSKTSRNMGNNAFDLAIESGLSYEHKKEREKHKTLFQIPFDPIRKRVTSLLQIGSKKVLVSRGAPEEVLDLCNLTQSEVKNAKIWIEKKANEGKRVLAVGYKNVSQKSKLKSQKDKDILDLEKDMNLIGLISFVDPVKPSAFDAIKKAQDLGVTLKILTGDSTGVARDVALKIGLINEGDQILTGDDFEALSISDKHKKVFEVNVFARLTPTQKYEIIKLLEEKNSVGFLGEGINDAPALKIANVAVVVAEASDVAREAADIILLKKDLNVILDGIEGGRKVFANTEKYIKTTMASNFGNFFAVASVSLFIDFLPMLPLQLLLVNLLSDFPNISVATDTVDSDELAQPKKYDLKSFAMVAILLGLVSTVFDFIFFGSFVKYGQSILQTSWFMGSILTELFFIFSVRTKKFMFWAKAPSKVLLTLSLLAIFVTILFPFTLIGQDVFGFTRPEFANIIRIFMISGMYIVVTEAVKVGYYRIGNRE